MDIRRKYTFVEEIADFESGESFQKVTVEAQLPDGSSFGEIAEIGLTFLDSIGVSREHLFDYLSDIFRE